MDNPTPKPTENQGPPSLQDWTCEVVERRSWAILVRFCNYESGADYHVVAVAKTPASVEIFGTRRTWVYGNFRDASRKLAEICGT